MSATRSILESVDLRDAGSVARALEAGAEANSNAPCRHGSVDVVRAGRGGARRLIATGDLHDNPLHLMRLTRAAGLEGEWDAEGERPGARAHLVLHELIHGERLVNGLDYSYRVLARVAALKAAHPGFVHVLLANHELCQLTGSPVVKEGVRCNEAFDQALEAAFGEKAGRVREAVGVFIRSMPLAARFVREEGNEEHGTECQGAEGDILCAHSLPSPESMARFDSTVLERALTEEDYASRSGAAHLMVWGRGHTASHLERLGNRWNVGLFVLGHEKAENGVMVVGPNAVVLNSDHERGVYWPIDLAEGRVRAEAALEQAVRLGG